VKRIKFVLGLTFLLLAAGAGGCVFVIDTGSLVRPGKPAATTEQRAEPVPAEPKSNPPSETVAALEKSVHEQVNQYRAGRNLPALKLDPRISERCRAHSAEMASDRAPFSHDGFEERVKAIGKQISYRSAAENLAYNLGYSDPVKLAVEGWIKSPGHRKNMEGEFDLTGVGIVQNAKGKYYFTQIFIRRR
jgi:uncharacterized protein YkwD